MSTASAPPSVEPGNTSEQEPVCTCWIISDGKAGVETQCFAVAEELNLQITLKRVSPRRPWSWLAPNGPADPKDRIGKPESDFAPPWPDIMIAGGRMTVPYVRAIRKHAGPSTYTVFLQDPRVGPDIADLIWVPEHDRRRGTTVFTTRTTPHRLTLAKLAERRRHVPNMMADAASPRVAVLIGGNSRSHTFSDEDQARLIRSLKSLAPHVGSMFITASRRTPPALATALHEVMDATSGMYWDGTGDNPFLDFLAHSDMLVVTADSANMVCETCVTGRPVYVFHPSGGSRKFNRLHDALEAHGATRRLPTHFDILDTWTYEPLSATEPIAAEIAERWERHRAMK